tara:strand:- start:2 stop:472 length:471 start_codon:yes stop_codon:yes gene_type:complete
MKKIAGIFIIIWSSFGILRAILGNFFYYELEGIFYYGGLPTLIDLIGYVGFILLCISLIKGKNTVSSNAVSSNAVLETPTSVETKESNPDDKPSMGLNIVSFLIPLVGLIIYLTEKDKSPIKAISAGKSALWGVGISVLLSIISVIISVSMINSMY